MKTAPWNPSPTLLGIGLVVFTVGTAACGESSPELPEAPSTKAHVAETEVLASATRDYPTFLARIPEGSESSYGFRNRQELEEVALGTPYRVVTVTQDDAAEAAGQLTPTDTWRVPVTISGTPRALLTVSDTAQGLQVVDFGAAELARSLAALETALALPPGTKRAVLRLFDMRRDFLVVTPPNQQAVFYPASPSPERAPATAERLRSSGFSRAAFFQTLRDQRKAVRP